MRCIKERLKFKAKAFKGLGFSISRVANLWKYYELVGLSNHYVLQNHEMASCVDVALKQVFHSKILLLGVQQLNH